MLRTCTVHFRPVSLIGRTRTGKYLTVVLQAPVVRFDDAFDHPAPRDVRSGFAYGIRPVGGRKGEPHFFEGADVAVGITDVRHLIDRYTHHVRQPVHRLALRDVIHYDVDRYRRMKHGQTRKIFGHELLDPRDRPGNFFFVRPDQTRMGLPAVVVHHRGTRDAFLHDPVVDLLDLSGKALVEVRIPRDDARPRIEHTPSALEEDRYLNAQRLY